MALKNSLIIIISSPSGVGKTTIAKKILKKIRKSHLSTSCTTRNPRKNERNKIDYFFISKVEFNTMIKQNAFLEHANVFNNLYGSTKEQVFKYLEQGQNVLFDIDWQGANQIKNQTLKFQLVSIFILPPSREVLHKRLVSRGEATEEVLQMRMQQFDKDVLHWTEYDYVVVNEDLNKCYLDIIGYLEKTKE